MTTYQDPALLAAQGPVEAPTPEPYTAQTNPISPPRSIKSNLTTFPENIYSLTAESHLMRLLKVLLGDAGVGQLRKRFLTARLQTVLTGAHFIDLDHFWGAIFGPVRTPQEVLQINPSTDLGTNAQWLAAEQADASYRSRITQFARGVSYGATPVGMELVAEALLSVECDIIEGWLADDNRFQTYLDLESYTYGQLEAFTYGELDGTDVPPPGTFTTPSTVQKIDRFMFIVRPKRVVTDDERRYVQRVLDKLRPSISRAVVNSLGLDIHIPFTPNGIAADSDFWDVKILTNPAIPGYLAQPEGGQGGCEQPRLYDAKYQGEAWSYLPNVSGVTSYATVAGSVNIAPPPDPPPPPPGSVGIEPPSIANPHVPTPQIISPDYQSIVFPDGKLVNYTPDRALLPPVAVSSGRACSEGIITTQVSPQTTVTSSISAPGMNSNVPPGLTFTPLPPVSQSDAVINGSPNTPLYIDRIPADTVISQIQVQAQSFKYGHDDLQRFWSTPPRWQSDTTIETIVVQFASPALVNYVSFDIAKFPQHWTASAFVEGSWVVVGSGDVVGSSPASFPALVSEPVDLHPQHSYVGHWQKNSLQGTFTPIETNQIRIDLVRNVGWGDPATINTFYYALQAEIALIVASGVYGSGPLAQIAAANQVSQIQIASVGGRAVVMGPNGLQLPGNVFQAYEQTNPYLFEGLVLGLPAAWQTAVNPPTGAPLGPDGRPVAYSLGVRNLDVGYRVAQYSDLPNLGLPIEQPFAHSKDMLGSPVTFTITRNRATDLLPNLPDSPNAKGPWKCEPQITSDCIVNLYLDVRDGSGEGQVVDRFLLDPLYTGPTFHLYWSNDDPPPGETDARDDSLILGQYNVTGTVVPDPLQGLIFSSQGPGYVDIANSFLQLDTSASWWIGFDLQPSFTQSDTTEHTIFDNGQVRIAFAEGIIRVVTDESADEIDLWTIFSQNDEIRFLVAYLDTANDFFDAGLYLFYRGLVPGAEEVGLPMSLVHPPMSDTAPYQGWTQGLQVRVGKTTPLTDPLVANPNAVFRFGAALTGSPTPGGFTLFECVLKGEPLTQMAAQQFFEDPSTLAYKPTWSQAPDIIDWTTNAYLRFDPRYILTETESNGELIDDSIGFVGGTPFFYPLLTWTPIARDYTLEKGFVYFSPAKARFWKFEFTNLTAEVYDAIMPVTKTMRTLTAGSTVTAPATGGVGRQYLEPGLAADASLVPYPYADRVALDMSRSQPLIDPSLGVLPTEALVVDDPIARLNVAQSQNQLLNQQVWQQPSSGPLHPLTSVHTYNETQVVHDSKVAYFVGLNSIQPFRIDYRADDDTWAYYEKFYDALNIASNTWDQNPGYLQADNPSQVVTSKVFSSYHPVTALQFATHQSPSVQLMPNDDFRDPSLLGSTFSDTSTWHKVGDAALTYNLEQSSVTIQRNTAPLNAPLTISGDLVDRPIHPVFGFRPTLIQDYQASASTFGGMASAQVAVPPRGRIHAAIKVLSNDVTLTEPITLELQILDNGGGVLATKNITITQPGLLVEDYVSYTLANVGWTNVSAQIIQTGAVASTWIVQQFSFFDEGIVWDFSVDGGTNWYPAWDIRNDPNGVVQFPQPGNALCYRATGYREDMVITSVQLRPWYHGPITTRKTTQRSGPMVSQYDQFPQITDDPDFKQWDNPIPRGWWTQYQALLAFVTPDSPVTERSKFYGRAFDETVSTPTDAFGRSMTLARQFAPGESIPTPIDVMRRALTMARTYPETVPTPTDTWFAVQIVGNDVVRASSLVTRPMGTH